MQNSHPIRRTVGNILLVAGLIILLGVAGYFGWTQIQAAELRAQLQQTPAPGAVAATAPTQTLPPATQQPTFTPAPPTPTRTPEPAATATSPVASADQPIATVVEPTQAPSATATALPPTPAPTATAVPLAAAPVRMVVPDLKIDAKVVPMGWEVVQTSSGPRSEWVIPKDDAGHHIDSALLEQPGNLVISGHNNIYAQVFKPISFAWDNDQRIVVDQFTDRSEILNGRQIQLFDAAGQAYTYTITEFYRLRDTGVPLEQRIANGRFMQPTADSRLTVITCWPPTNNTHRLIVIATPAQ